MEYIDNIYGVRKLPKSCGAVVNTATFQRLRHIAVLGPVQWVIPSMNHTMFEHAIGSAIVTYEWMRHLSTRYHSRFIISEKDIECAAIASLLRHIGCMPWNDTFHEFRNSNHPSTKTKEIFSREIAREMFNKDGPLAHMEHHREFILDLITGTVKPCDYFKTFIFTVVHATVDASFFDRTLRDANRFGINHGIRVMTIITASVITETFILEIPIEVLNPMMRLRSQVDTHIAKNTEIAAMKVLIKQAWAHVPMMELVCKGDVRTLLDITDTTFQYHVHFAFFYQDIVSKRFPELMGVRYMTTHDEVLKLVAEEWGVNHHISTIRTGFDTYTFVVREFSEI